MALAIFDLDNTLIGGDSDVLWGDFLGTQGYVDANDYKQAHERFYQDYMAGELDILAFLRFQLQILTEHDTETLFEWRRRFIEDHVRPIMLPKAMALIEQHRKAGDELLIITATNRFITEPIAKLLGIKHLLAAEPEMVNGRYTGNIVGTPTYAEGKVTRLHEWLAETELNLNGSFFYSDSRNDLPLLRLVDNPVAVDADPTLTQEATEKGWAIISLR